MNKKLLFTILIVLFIVTAITATFFGAVDIIPRLIDHISGVQVDEKAVEIFRDVRFPRTVGAIIAGAGLALSGLILQTVLRNPLADPYILGISSGAAVVVTLFSIIGITFPGGIALGAFIGAMLSIGFVFVSARFTKGKGVLLSGVALNFLLSSLLGFLLYLNKDHVENIYFWTMGSLGRSYWPKIMWTAPLVVVPAIIVWLLRKELNIIQLQNREALSLGINTRRMRLLFIFLAAVMTASSVALAGTIGFAGLVVPQLIRLILSDNKKPVIPAVMLAGPILLLISDLIARTLMAPRQIPLGIITSAIGAPVFLYLLFKGDRR